MGRRTKSNVIGRPSRLSQELQDELCKYLSLGCYPGESAAMVGLPRDTLTYWLKRGATELDNRRKHKDVIQAEGEHDKERVRKIRTEERQRRDKRNQQRYKTKRKEERYVTFLLAVKKAMAHAELNDLGTIAMASKGGHLLEKKTKTNHDGTTTTTERRSKPEWQAAAWRLERRNPKRWARVQRLEVSGDEDGAPIALSMADAIKAAYSKRLERETKNVNEPIDVEPEPVDDAEETKAKVTEAAGELLMLVSAASTTEEDTIDVTPSADDD